MWHLIENPETTNQKSYELKPGENTIGREKDNHIVIDNKDMTISRYHAKVTIGDDGVFISNLKSNNHTYVNEATIDSCQLKDGDVIRCGRAVFKFVHTGDRSKSASLSPDARSSLNQTSEVMQELLETDIPENQESVLRLRQENANQRVVDKLKILLEVSKQLSSPEEINRLLEKILNLLFKIMRVDRAVILMFNEETGELEAKAEKFRYNRLKDENFYSTNIANHVYHGGKEFLTADACIDEQFNDAESVILQKIHASMCVPMKARERVIGVLYVDNLSMANAYTGEDLEFMTALANTAAIAIDNAQLYKKMQAEAVTLAKFERFFPQSVRKKLREEDKLEIVDTEVTAIFCDISGFTEMSSSMEPRQVIEMLNEYFKVMVEDIVFQYEGTLEKYIGDALLAIWGAPYQFPDDAARAVKAACAMQSAMRRLNQQWLQQGFLPSHHLPIQIHIGINSGKVAAGNIGSPRLIQYATIGDTTNVTSRICSAAKAGEILISQSTFDKLNDTTVPIEPIPPVMVKGKDQPLQLYLVKWEQMNLL